MVWKIETYKTPSGQEFGPELAMPHTKPLGGGLYELRVRGTQEVRVFYIYTRGDIIYLVHAFHKKTQVIPKKELELARQRQTEINHL